jgi:DNA polymerase-3 subunit alpha
MSDFTHLHAHSDFSIKDAITTPEKLASRLNKIDQKSWALTDHGSMAGIAVFDKHLKKHGIKLIAGLEAYVASISMQDTSTRDTGHLTLLAADMVGYRNLCKLHSLSWQRPAYYYDPRIDLDTLSEFADGLIVLSGCMGSFINKPMLKGERKLAESRVKELHTMFGKNFYIELQDHDIEGDEDIIDFGRAMASKYKIKMVATNDAHYVEKDDWRAHDMIIACGTGQVLGNANRPKEYVPEKFFVKSYDDMEELFEPAVLKQSQLISNMCEPLKLESKIFHIPKFTPRPKGLIESLYGT